MDVGKFGSVIFSISLAFLVMQPAFAEESMPVSAFIGGQLNLEHDPDRAGAYLDVKHDLDLSGYSSVLIEPVEIWIHPDSEYKGIEPDVVKAIGDGFAQILIDELAPDYPTVNKAGPETLVIRLAIIGIKMKKKKRGLIGWTPIGLVVGALNTDALKRVSLIDAGIEAEILDSVTGERLGVLVDTGISRSLSASEKDELSWEDHDMSLRFYAKRIHSRIDKAKK